MNRNTKFSENINYRNISSDSSKIGSFVGQTSPYGNVGSQLPPTMSGSPPPPLPPRPNLNNDRYMNYMNRSPINYVQPFNGYGNPFFNPMQALNSFGLNGMNGLNRFNNYGTNYDPQEDYFSRLAEDSSRPVFQSIESIVGAFSSVSMMLESTYVAVHNSFRAIVGVADHFSRIRNQLTQMLSTLAILSTLRSILSRILRILRLNRFINIESYDNSDTDSVDKAWTDANSLVNELGIQLNADGTFKGIANTDIQKHSSWPIVLFFVIVFGTPWLLWKILSNFEATNKFVSNKWMNSEGEHYLALALYDFASDNTRELSFKAGQRLIIAPKDLQPRVKGWLLASNDQKKVGLIPANYIRIDSYMKSRDNYQNK